MACLHRDDPDNATLLELARQLHAMLFFNLLKALLRKVAIIQSGMNQDVLRATRRAPLSIFHVLYPFTINHAHGCRMVSAGSFS